MSRRRPLDMVTGLRVVEALKAGRLREAWRVFCEGVERERAAIREEELWAEIEASIREAEEAERRSRMH